MAIWSEEFTVAKHPTPEQVYPYRERFKTHPKAFQRKSTRRFFALLTVIGSVPRQKHF